MTAKMKRRDFITLLGGATMAWPLAARAQQAALPVIGFLDVASAAERADYMRGFVRGLAETGYIEGQNVAIEYRWAEGQYDRVPSMVAELVRRQVAVIVANTPGNLAARAATTTIPIVFSTAGDPVQMGLVASLNRPGGNITGVTSSSVEVIPKRLELARELSPTATIIAVLVNPANANIETQLKDLQAAARALEVQFHVLHASNERDFDTVFATLAQLRAAGLVIGSDAFFNSQSERLAELALRRAVPAIYQYRRFAAAGGLISYGSSLTESYQQVGVYTGRILKGEKPANLPVQQSTKAELIINIKTAKTLALTMPPTLLRRADEVIE